MLKGKHYNSAVRVHKYIYEAIKRLLIENFKKWICNQSDTLDITYREFKNSLELQELVSAPKPKTMENVYENCEKVVEEIHKYEQLLLDGYLGPTASVWTSFLQMEQILFDFIRSIKLGNWNLHMQAMEKMLPWMFAYDCPNYARFLTYYWVFMQKLPETHPAIHEEFMAGNFSVCRQHGTFNKILSDQAIEQTINRDQKCKVVLSTSAPWKVLYKDRCSRAT